MSLKERMAARFGGDIPMKQTTSMHTATDNLTAAQREALARGPGHKRAAEETTIFKELQQMANAGGDDDSDLEILGDSKALGSMAHGNPQVNPADLSKRRQYAALQEVQPNASSRPAQKAQAKAKAPAQAKAPARRRRAVLDDSEDESSSGWDSDESEEESKDQYVEEESDLSEYEL